MFGKRFKEFLLGLLSGFLFYLAFSKYDLNFLIFPALYIGLKKEKLTFFTFGFTSFILSLWWLRLPILQSGDYPYIYAILGALIIAFSLALIQFGLTYLLWRIFSFKILALPLIYISVELFRSHFPFTGFPWLILGTSLIDIPFFKYALVPFSVYGGSLVILLISLFPRFKKGKLFVALAILLLPLLGFLQRKDLTSKINISVAIVQPNVPQYIKLDKNLFEKEYPLILNLVKEAQRNNPDVVFLPESSVPFYLSEINTKGKELLELSKKTPIILGIIEIEEPFEPYNSVVLLSNGKIVDKYRKHILVPFGEYTPFPFKYLSSLIPYFGLTDYKTGNDTKCFHIKNLTIGTPICFEVAYPFYIKKFRCNIIAVLTNDGWFLDSDGTYQHLSIARARAIETGTFILWVNNTGPSAIISPKGNILRILPYGKKGILFFTF